MPVPMPVPSTQWAFHIPVSSDVWLTTLPLRPFSNACTVQKSMPFDVGSSTPSSDRSSTPSAACPSSYVAWVLGKNQDLEEGPKYTPPRFDARDG